MVRTYAHGTTHTQKMEVVHEWGSWYFNVQYVCATAAGSRFKSAKIPATVKFAFNREYIVRITADSSLILGCAQPRCTYTLYLHTTTDN